MKKAPFNWSKKITWPLLIVGLVMAIIIGYSWSRTSNLLRGPTLTLIPVQPEAPHSPLIKLEGEVERVAHLWLNGGKIFADSQGHFSERLLLIPGYNIIKLAVVDRFGRSITKYLELNYDQEAEEGGPAVAARP